MCSYYYIFLINNDNLNQTSDKDRQNCILKIISSKEIRKLSTFYFLFISETPRIMYEEDNDSGWGVHVKALLTLTITLKKKCEATYILCMYVCQIILIQRHII